MIIIHQFDSIIAVARLCILLISSLLFLLHHNMTLHKLPATFSEDQRKQITEWTDRMLSLFNQLVVDIVLNEKFVPLLPQEQRSIDENSTLCDLIDWVSLQESLTLELTRSTWHFSFILSSIIIKDST